MIYGTAGIGTSGIWTGMVEDAPVATWFEAETVLGPTPKSSDVSGPKGLAATIKKIVIMVK